MSNRTEKDHVGSDEFFDDLETVVYGCHAESREQIRQVFAKEGLYTFSFAEYFLDEPVTKLTGDRQNVQKRKLYLPFLPWSVSQLLFRVSTTAQGQMSLQSKNKEWKDQLRVACCTGMAMQKWETQTKRIVDFVDDNTTWDEVESITEVKDFKSFRKEAVRLGGERDPGNEALVSYNSQLHPWSLAHISQDAPLIIFRHPIASKHCYYGHFAIVYQQNQSCTGNELTSLQKNLKGILEKLAEDRYSPILALLHLSKWEKLLAAAIEKYVLKKDSTFLNNILKNEPSPVSLGWEESPNDIERAFGRLWGWRNRKWKEAKKQKVDKRKELLEWIKNSIILDKYHIASPAMINQVKKVVSGAPLLKARGQKASSLPSALIFGQAGSGKDQMARLIGTLSEDFWHVRPLTQNMAALKPSLLAVPLMFGIQHKDLNTPGIFRIKENGHGNPPDPQILILDELNSLDYDMQGSLLRLLENNEALPMFSAGPPSPVNALVIGVVNEDPERVTREQELRHLDGAREFLGQAEAARLYEALHSARRLRPDLVYRLKRGVYVRMPALRDRKEDIPLLFSNFCKEPIKDLAECENTGKHGAFLHPDVQFDLEAYDELMRRDLIWPGNIRQLQAVAKKVACKIWDARDRIQDYKKGWKIRVTHADVEKVLAEEFPDAYPRQSVHPE